MKHQKMAALQGKTAPEKLADLKNRVHRLATLYSQEISSQEISSQEISPQEIRLSASVEVIAVSKGQDQRKIIPLLEAGHRVFGENRVPEAQEKWPALKREFPDVVLHLIGSLQTNKIDEALDLFDVIQSVDRKKLADKLFACASSGGRRGRRLPELFIQINTGCEPQKSGILPQEADAFIAYCRDELNLPVKGLMCLPPLNHNPAPHFALLHQMGARHHLPYLSMGMSHDFDAAILLGATHIRPGRIIFGAEGGAGGGAGAPS